MGAVPTIKFNALRSTVFATIFAALLATLQAANVYAGDTDIEQQRKLYQEARRQLAKGNYSQFKQLSAQLHDYPLYPYLEYAELASHATPMRQKSVVRFLKRYGDTPMAGKLRSNWLNQLRGRGDWKRYVRYYSPQLNSVEHACHYHYGLYRLGQHQEAIAGGLQLWLVGKSQPSACDPLFEVLTNTGTLTQQVVWQRYTLAVLNHEYRLANHLANRFTTPELQQRARDYLAVDQQPTRVAQYDLFSTFPPEVVTLIEHGISHLAQKDATAALKHWARYQQIAHFDKAAQGRVLTQIVQGLFRQGHPQAAYGYMEDRLDVAQTDLLEWRLRLDLRARDWRGLANWTGKLPDEIRQQPTWNYWHPRAMSLAEGTTSQHSKILSDYQNLTQSRSFYGFLACDWLGVPYAMQHNPVTVTDIEVDTLANTASMRRAREFLLQNELLDARREWYHAGQNYNAHDWQVAARLAQRWQWHQQAILAMTRAPHWDDINIRFPLPFRQDFDRNAVKHGLPLQLLLAVSRQESAFAPDVVSPAGARGLMQLMPATAKMVAKQHRVDYRQLRDLENPSINVQLGSHYYNDMIKKFNGNRILATAAYNAGPHRVNRWLKDSGGVMPFDAWIETIPFKETRNYVQNVLAFSAIYSHHLGNQDKILSDRERAELL